MFLEITAYAGCVNGIGMSDFQFDLRSITVTDYCFYHIEIYEIKLISWSLVRASLRRIDIVFANLAA
ncbi:hypothetical protein KB20921_01780 [Edwardsiella ictaluri]|uniref:Uncharacterized protein n=1 Tax=Edwardsiella ictaluri (strain 93-146) TaxID=634503 RepID=C5B6Z0_EDWI9|nr:hypothetical protein NT01EI_0209 [Edwardsiella ictaluri 93-146]BEH97451.1 hypothetical protein KH20906_01790 [Edwardsiella ictaluri]BEI00917.1 hypothetical protein KB20921_01780 [Edwardsiella ictaluri]BEI04393.1 hypothetical protein KH201010_01790 [Edwardsiella ictaluri]BEI07847.1 hypothetical protein STU22726_01780 [Edwardsiella ictaluri]